MVDQKDETNASAAAIFAAAWMIGNGRDLQPGESIRCEIADPKTGSWVTVQRFRLSSAEINSAYKLLQKWKENLR